MIETQIEQITPQVAREYLDRAAPNRTLVPHVVDAYATDMKNGMWRRTHQGVAFNVEGLMVDGQHRMAAVIKAGVTVTMPVTRGVPIEAMTVMDTGRKRTVADLIKINAGDKYVNHAVVAAVARLALAYEVQDISVTRLRSLSSSQIYEYAVHHVDELQIAANRARELYTKVPAPQSVIGAAFLIFRRVDPEACERFFNALVHMRTDGEGDPRLALLRRLNTIRAERTKVNQMQSLDMFLRAWNHWREGKTADRVLVGSPRWRKAI